MSTLVIRADASAGIGVGHAMRCLALAQAWKDRGGAVTLASAHLPDAVARRFSAEGIEIANIPALSEADDAKRTAEIARARQAEWVAVDGYHFGARHQEEGHDAGAKVLAIDDHAHAGTYVADLILNQNLHATPALYVGIDSSRVLCGPRFVLLRREFRTHTSFARQTPVTASRGIVTMGGSDVGPLAGVVNAVLGSVASLDFTIVAGAAQHGFEERGGRVRIVPSPEDMAALMHDADIAVASAGSTAWELAFMQVPALLVTLAENQRAVAACLDREGAARSLGCASAITADALTDAIQGLAADGETRGVMAHAGRRLIDGAGVDRVLMRMRGSPLRLRRVAAEDCRQAWEWANDPATRAVSFTSAPIPWEDHVRWFSAKIAHPGTAYFIGVDADDRPVGQVRIERAADEDAGIISVVVDAQQHGRGLGTRMITEACLAQASAIVIAYVKPANNASIRAFTRAGFQPAGEVRVHEQDALRFVWRRQP
jgi:UDP-2,4-diacetamido-2,4,6-trideoxy-beta-L-altropyranose hydrolase